MIITSSICALILAGVFIASVISGILGMAGGVLLMGLLVWILPVQHAMVLHAVSQFASNAGRAWIHRRHIHKKGLWLYFAGAAVIFCAFAAVALVPSKMTVFLLLGAGPFVAFALPKSWALDFAKPLHAFLSGFLVTFFQLTCGAGGPVQAVFFQSESLSRHETVATKAFTQVAAHVTKFVYFGFVAGNLAADTHGVPMWLYIAVVPVALFGTRASTFALDKLTDKQFYRATQGVLFVIGAVYLLKAFMLWRHS